MYMESAPVVVDLVAPSQNGITISVTAAGDSLFATLVGQQLPLSFCFIPTFLTSAFLSPLL